MEYSVSDTAFETLYFNLSNVYKYIA